MAFVKVRDFNFFQSINKELIDDFIETAVIIFRIDRAQSDMNMYGESVSGKTYLSGVQINALIDKANQISNYEGFGSDTAQGVEFRFLRTMLQDVEFKPTVGDIINFNNLYYEVSNVIDNEFVAGNVDFKNSIICETTIKRKSSLNIEDLR